MSRTRRYNLLLSVVWGLWVLVAPAGAEVVSESSYGGLLCGYGMSYPGWGETTERVQVLDVIPRFCRVLDEKMGQDWYCLNRELWVETPISLILSDTDSKDNHDVGVIGTSFLLALVSKARSNIEPYLIAGGGPVYLLGDIKGVGSDLCGHYQAGGGVRFKVGCGQVFNLEVRYHHISNLDMASPNVPLNSTKVLLGTTWQF